MAAVSPFAEDVDVCRNRYYHLAEGLGTGGRSNGSSGGAHGGDQGSSRERRRLLELGAMTVLEAELETLTMDSSSCASTAAEGRHHDRGNKGQERERYRSCLEAMLGGHYDTLDALEGEDGLPESGPSSRLESIMTNSTSTTATPLATVSRDAVRGEAFRPVEVSALLAFLPGLAAPEPSMITAPGGCSTGFGGAAEAPIAAAAAAAAANGHGRVSGAAAPSLGSRSGNGSAAAQRGPAPHRQPQQGAQAVADVPVNPYALRASASSGSSSGTAGRGSNANANTGAAISPFPPSSIRGMEGVRTASPTPPNFPQQRQRQQQQQQHSRQPPHQQQRQRQPDHHHDDQHHQQQGPHQQRHQHQRQQQQAAAPGPLYGDRTANGSSFAAGGAGQDTNATTTGTTDGWASREPRAAGGGRRGLLEAPAAAAGGGGAGVWGGPGQQTGQVGSGGASRTTGPFKTARELKAADLGPGTNGNTNNKGGNWNGGNGDGNDNDNDRSRRRGGEQQQPQQQQQQQQQQQPPRRSWDGRENGNGRGGGMWGGGGGGHQGQRGYGYGSGFGGSGGGGGGYNRDSPNRNGRFVGNFDDDPPPAQGPPITPRLPNGSGLVRKRKFFPPGRLDNGNGSNNNNNGGGGGGGGGSNGAGGRGRFPGSAALGGRGGGGGGGTGGGDGEEELPEELQHLEKAMVDKIMQEVQQRGDPVTFDQIAGLEFAKQSVIELVCWPMSRPDIFTGLRSLPKGLLLFGPPGTGKTLIGKAIAHQSGATFFSISASSLCSKWIGEGEKMVRTLFAVASYRQPAVIFIDEVDSMLSMRSADENEASRRLKTEFLIQLDGAGTKAADRVLVVGATNRPQELDEAARRRFVKRLYVPLPDKSGRRQLMNILLKTSPSSLTPADVEEVVDKTEGFSGADLHSLCTEAAMGPVRDLGSSICSVKVSDVPPMETRHFTEARQSMRPSVGAEEIKHYLKWNEEFGSFKRA